MSSKETTRMDPYLLLARAVIVQAFEDLQSPEQNCAERARWWLERDGLDWWEMIGFDRAVLQQWLDLV